MRYALSSQVGFCDNIIPRLILFLGYVLADYVYKAIDALPVTSHPMTQFTSGVMALQVVDQTLQ